MEPYQKFYRRLPLQDALQGFVSRGYGSAGGLDVYVRRAWPRGEIRANYSLLHTRRRWTAPEEFNRYDLPAGTWVPDFSIPHSAQIVATLRPAEPLALGASWRIASGRPHTPILGAASGERGLEPVFGPINAERLPRYERLDLSASFLRPAWGGLAVVFLGLSNALARDNAFQYVYSADFSARRLVTSAAPRSWYVGVSLTQ